MIWAARSGSVGAARAGQGCRPMSALVFPLGCMDGCTDAEVPWLSDVSGQLEFPGYGQVLGDAVSLGWLVRACVVVGGYLDEPGYPQQILRSEVGRLVVAPKARLDAFAQRFRGDGQELPLRRRQRSSGCQARRDAGVEL